MERLKGVVKLLGNCSRRWREPEEEEASDSTPFWASLPQKPGVPEVNGDEDIPALPHGFELATSLKDNGNDYFSKGSVDEAISIWTQALDALHAPPSEDGDRAPAATAAAASGGPGRGAAEGAAADGGGLGEAEAEGGGGAAQGATPAKGEADAASAIAAASAARRSVNPEAANEGLKKAAAAASSARSAQKQEEDPRVVELRATLFCNFALGHMKQKQWRQGLNFCDEALLDQPKSQKALYRKADCLAELGDWAEAEEVLVKMEELGEDAARLVAQKREMWKKRRKAADDKQKKMWSAALAKSTKEASADEDGAASAAKAPEGEEAAASPGSKPKDGAVASSWSPPKIAPTSVFDLRFPRRAGVKWDEDEDFSDKVWREELRNGPKPRYFKEALPLSLLAASTLADLDLESTLTLHCILDGNTAPFSDPHDWGLLLRRLPHVRSLMVIYVDIGTARPKKGKGKNQMPYGVLLRPVEEFKDGDRTVHTTRFMGTYKEFREHSRELPGVVAPNMALWADVPLYGRSEKDLAVRVEALSILASFSIPIVFTQESEVPEFGGAPGGPWLVESARQSLAILELGLGARAVGAWHWNRFVIPLDQTEKGILVAHALVGVIRPSGAAATGATAASVLKALEAQGVQVSAAAPAQSLGPPTSADEAALKAQWFAFCEKLYREGRPIGPDVSEEEKARQMKEFGEFCRSAPPRR